MIIPTPTSLRTQNRRLDRRLASARAVLNVMESGAVLHRMHTRRGTCWALSNGTSVNDDVARVVVGSSSVIGVGDTLLPDRSLSQTFRWWRGD